jgi:GT2 family glycosyltransferase
MSPVRTSRPSRQARQTLKPRAAAWLGTSAVLLVGPFEDLHDSAIEGSADFDGEAMHVDAAGITYIRDHDSSSEPIVGILVGRFPRVPGMDGMPNAVDQLRFSWAQYELSATDLDLVQTTTDLMTLTREELAALSAANRNDLCDFLSRTFAASPPPERHAVAQDIYRMREVLRERLPACVTSESSPRGIQLEQIAAADDSTYWIKGWLRDADPDVTLTMVSPEGSRAELRRTDLFTYPRPDVAKFYSGLGDDVSGMHGFITHVELPAPSVLPAEWTAELYSPLAGGVEVSTPPPVRGLDAVRDVLFRDLALEKPLGGPLTRDHAHPVLERLLRRSAASVEVDDVTAYGPEPRSPSISIVIPLYGRIDLLEHQIFHFSKDPQFRDVELIYVLDSPEHAEALARLAAQVHSLYDLPFRVITLNRNGGFAIANNIGAATATGERLLLLNSDVIPCRPGWLEQLAARHSSVKSAGSVAPKLLYEDDSLQHAGLYFYRPEGLEVWENAHCFKGAHRTFPPANVSREVPAVTAACVMLSRAVFEELGGLSGEYLRGDYEDSDLCLRLRRRGLESWYVADVELYHLEGQSYLPDIRRQASEYNRWLHTHRWSSEIEEAMAGFDPHTASGGSSTGGRRARRRSTRTP